MLPVLDCNDVQYCIVVMLPELCCSDLTSIVAVLPLYSCSGVTCLVLQSRSSVITVVT